MKPGKPWSLTGAARSARDARIATVKYLRHAPSARLWQMGKLQRAFQLQAAQVGGTDEAAVLLFGGLGYRPPFPADWQAATELVLADEARYLRAAELYILTPQMCDVVIAAAQTLTREDLELLGADDPPGLAGLVVLPHPVIVRAVSGDLGDDRAFTWRLPSQIQRPSADGRRLVDAPAIRISAYHNSCGPVRPDSFVDFAATARRQGTPLPPLPPLLLDSIRCLPLRYAATPDQVLAREEYLAAARETGAAVRDQAAALGLDEERVVGEYTPGEQIDDGDDTFMQRFLYAFWRLCEQDIAVVGHAESNHSARVVAERAGVSPDVRIVRLRRAVRHDHGGRGGRDWQHRWPVRMHRVRQWYPKLGVRKVLYRGPFIKGPADKLLLGGETVRALIR